MYSREFWTSKLDIYSDLDNDVIDKIVNKIRNYIDIHYNSFISDSDVNQGRVSPDAKLIFKIRSEFDDLYEEFITYDGKVNYTGFLKGFFIDLVGDEIEKLDNDASYLINFGGDIKGKNTSIKVKIENSNVIIERSGDFVICTSGNTDKRGNHIKILNDLTEILEISTLTLVSSELTCIECDMLTTAIYSDMDRFKLLDGIDHDFIPINKIGKFMNKITDRIYCASPFFNKEEINTRNKMIRNLKNVFRPDQTESSRSYSTSPGPELSKKIFEDNVNGIKDSKYLLFPEGTNDLGTLFEVGMGLKLHKHIIRFNPDEDTYTFVDNDGMCKKLDDMFESYVDYVVECTKSSGAVVLGYNYDNSNIYYDVGNQHDNIMLSENFKRVRLIDEDKYELVEKNYKEIL